MSSKNTKYHYPEIVQVLVVCNSGGSIAPPLRELKLLLKSGRAWTGGTNKARRYKAEQVIRWIKDLGKSKCMRIVQDDLGEEQANWDQFYADLTPEKKKNISKDKMIGHPELDHEWMQLGGPPVHHPSWAQVEEELQDELEVEDEDFDPRAYDADKKLREAGGQQPTRTTRSSTRSVSPIRSSSLPQTSSTSKSTVLGHGDTSGVRIDHSGRFSQSPSGSPTPSNKVGVSHTDLVALSEDYDKRDEAIRQSNKELTKAQHQVRQEKADLDQTQQDLLRREEQLNVFEATLQAQETALQLREDRFNTFAANLHAWAGELKQWQQEEIAAANEHAGRLQEVQQWILNEKNGSGMIKGIRYTPTPPPEYPR